MNRRFMTLTVAALVSIEATAEINWAELCFEILPGKPAQTVSYAVRGSYAKRTNRCEGYYDENQSHTAGVVVLSTLIGTQSIAPGIEEIEISTNAKTAVWLTISPYKSINYRVDRSLSRGFKFLWEVEALKSARLSDEIFGAVAWKTNEETGRTTYYPIATSEYETSSDVMMLGVRFPSTTIDAEWRLGCGTIDQNKRKWQSIKQDEFYDYFVPVPISSLPTFVEFYVNNGEAMANPICFKIGI